MKRFLGAISLVTVAGVVLACGTIMHGTTQEISISSRPSGATVVINGIRTGETPMVADLERKERQALLIELDGYDPYGINLERRLSDWAWGNIVFAIVVGFAVDAATGGLYRLEPEEVRAELQRRDPQGAAAFELDGDRLVVFVVLEPEPGWERVGQLEPGAR